MKKFLWVLLFVLQIFPLETSAQSVVTKKKDSREIIVRATSFHDYFPISYVTKESGNELMTVFTPVLEQVAEMKNLKFKYVSPKNYDNAVIDVRRGATDVLLGMYYDTKQYSGLEYIFPAVLNNPVYIIMRPENIAKVSKPEDLKNLRGIYISKEYFSDYMHDNFISYNIQPVETALKAYEQLFTGEADYIAGSYYYNYAQMCRLGLKDYVSFSKTALWNMPLFIGVSKASQQYAKIVPVLKTIVAEESFSQNINNTLKEFIYEAERKSQGVVPPMFIKQSTGKELTPADEAQKDM